MSNGNWDPQCRGKGKNHVKFYMFFTILIALKGNAQVVTMPCVVLRYINVKKYDKYRI